jgi:arabinose-5-phosphate isomerase
MNILQEARRVLEIEIASLVRTKELLNEGFEQAVNLIYRCRGKVIITGMGKSGLIGRKIAATLSSTGTLSVFMHPAEGMHGDLGIVTADDVIIALSKGGESDELLGILPSVKKIGAKVISFVGNKNSSLARASDIVIDASVEKEACPINLAPTASTTVTLVLGDALAAVLLKLRGFQPTDFALYHPGGKLGKQLLLRVSDLMHSGEQNPLAYEDTPVSEVLIEMTSKAMGGVNIVDKDHRLVGIITDGDLRRALQRHDKLLMLSAKDIMTKNPVKVTGDVMAVEALALMENRPSQIMVLPVVEKDNRVVGILRLHDLVRVGL